MLLVGGDCAYCDDKVDDGTDETHVKDVDAVVADGFFDEGLVDTTKDAAYIGEDDGFIAVGECLPST